MTTKNKAAKLPSGLTRRALIANGGALVVGFSLSDAFAQAPATPPAAGAAPAPPPLPGSLRGAPMIDSWIRIDAAGKITVLTGKVEIGQGAKTALRQVAAEHLNVPFGSVDLVTADTARTANEGYTAGSQTMQDSGTAIMHAAAQAREILIRIAAEKIGVDAASLKAEDGFVVAADGKKLGYGELVAGDVLAVEVFGRKTKVCMYQKFFYIFKWSRYFIINIFYVKIITTTIRMSNYCFNFITSRFF